MIIIKNISEINLHVEISKIVYRIFEFFSYGLLC